MSDPAITVTVTQVNATVEVPGATVSVPVPSVSVVSDVSPAVSAAASAAAAAASAASAASVLTIGHPIINATAGSILFAGASGVLAQDNANFKWGTTAGQGLTAHAGTAASAVSAFELSQTWNYSTAAITGVKWIFTDTLSHADTKAFEILGGPAGTTSLFALTKGGNVGIGTTNPGAYLLNVNGSANITGNLNFNNSGVEMYITQGASTQRSINIPGSSGNGPWRFYNATGSGVSIYDSSNSNLLTHSFSNSSATNASMGLLSFTSLAYSTTGRAATVSPTLTLGNSGEQFGDSRGINVLIKAGQGGSITNSHGGDVIIDSGLGGGSGEVGNILLATNIAGNVGIGTTGPTAKLHLPAATASADTASLKIPSGVVATIPAAGNIEADALHIYWTKADGTRLQLDNV